MPALTHNYNYKVKDYYRIRNENVPPMSVGLEIECEGENLYATPLRWWRGEADGSLRTTNGHPPIEYVLRKPIIRDQLPAAFDYLEEKLKESGAKLVHSPRTSVHVHVNATDCTLKQVVTWYCLYLCVEDLLLRFCGPTRESNLFCLGVKDATGFKMMLETAIAEDDYHLQLNQLRYSACNWAALPKYGSLEFRSMRGTLDRQTILDWVDILLSIKTKALSLDNPQDVIRLFDRVGAANMAANIITDERLYKLITNGVDQKDMTTMVWAGLRRARDLAFSSPVWEVEKPARGKIKAEEPATMTNPANVRWVEMDDIPPEWREPAPAIRLQDAPLENRNQRRARIRGQE